MSPSHIREVKAVMKKCQIGFPKHMIDESNNLHADCYGTMGKLMHDLVAAHAEIVRLRTALMRIQCPEAGADSQQIANSVLRIG